MQRRELIRAASLAGGAGVLSACSIRRVDGTTTSELPRVRWRMATSWPHALDTIYGGAQTIADQVGAMSGGRFTIEPYAAGEIVPGLQVLDAVQNGAVECGHTASYYYVGKNPALAFGTAVPFGLTPQQQNTWLYEGGGNDALNRIYADFGVRSFAAGNTGPQMGGWFKNQLDGPESLKGLKMRIPGLGGKVMAALGVNVQVLPGGEIYLALERGAIDAAEFTGPYDDSKLGLPKAARFYYYPGWWEPGPTLTALVNQRAWAKLPKAYQEMFESACQSANLLMLSRYDRLNAKALETLRQGPTKVEFYGDGILEAARAATDDLMADIARGDAGFNSLWSEWKQFRQLARSWNEVTELSYTRFSDGN